MQRSSTPSQKKRKVNQSGADGSCLEHLGWLQYKDTLQRFNAYDIDWSADTLQAWPKHDPSNGTAPEHSAGYRGAELGFQTPWSAAGWAPLVAVLHHERCPFKMMDLQLGPLLADGCAASVKASMVEALILAVLHVNCRLVGLSVAAIVPPFAGRKLHASWGMIQLLL